MISRTRPLALTGARSSLSSPLFLSLSHFRSLSSSSSVSSSAPPNLPPKRRSMYKVFGGFAVASGLAAASFSSSSSASAGSPSFPSPTHVISSESDSFPLPIPDSWSAFLASSPSLTLYQYETCPFCNKLRTYLDSTGLPYQVIEVEPTSKGEIKWSKYRKVPILVFNNIQMNDSSITITKLHEYLTKIPGNPLVQRFAKPDAAGSETQWRQSIDNEYIPLFSPNMYRSWSESCESFAYIDEQAHFPAHIRLFSKYFGIVAMHAFWWLKFRKRTEPGKEREAIYGWANRFVKDGLNGKPYRGSGDKPDLSDVQAFGVTRALSKFSVGKDLLNAQNTSQEFVDWYQRMSEWIGPSRRSNPKPAPAK